VPITQTGFLQAAFPSAAPVLAEPGYVTVALPASWVLQTSVTQSFAIALYTSGVGTGARWYPPADGSAAHVPARALATPSTHVAIDDVRGLVEPGVAGLRGRVDRRAKDGLLACADAQRDADALDDPSATVTSQTQDRAAPAPEPQRVANAQPHPFAQPDPDALHATPARPARTQTATQSPEDATETPSQTPTQTFTMTRTPDR